MTKDNLGDRMKEYEWAYSIKLPRRMPVILRIDGRAFHTLTKGCDKPFDAKLIACMQVTAIKLMQEIQGALFCYVQSDEINILINNYQSLVFDSWFDNKLQKICSISASIASVEFTKAFGKDAIFDCRAFVLPKEEVVNYFIWRQKDWIRNSIQMLGRSEYSSKQMHGKHCDDIKEMCKAKGKDWDGLQGHIKKGTCLTKGVFSVGIDPSPPIFTEDRDFIQKWVDYTKEV